MYVIRSKLTIKAPEQCQKHRYGVFVDFTHCSGVSIVDFEQANISWVRSLHDILKTLQNGIKRTWS